MMSDNNRAAGPAPEPMSECPPGDRSRSVFGGLTPRIVTHESVPSSTLISSAFRVDTARRARSAAFTTVPIVLTGAIALGMGLASPIDPAHARKPVPPKPEQSPPPLALRTALAQIGAAMIPGGLASQSVTTHGAPAVYTVAAGDTVSSIAQRFSLSTVSVLALNGLSWKSAIFPGQVLTLTDAPVKTTGSPAPTTQAGRYQITKGDTISSLAMRFGVSTQVILDANGLTWSSIVYPGQIILVPGRIPHPTPSRAPVVGTAHDAPGAEQGAPITITNGPQSKLDVDAGLAPGTTETVPASAPVVAAMAIAEQPTVTTAPGRPGPATRSSSPSAPPAAPPSSAPPAAPPSGGVTTPLTSEMRTHATTIIQVGRQLGVPEYGIVIALATAMQESSLRNLSWGDRDSVGLFQQRPASGWGTSADLQVPSHAARLFYVGRPGFTRGLLGISGWQNMTLTRAAQAVQISAFPNHYAKWEASAWAWYFELT
jgi:LysM repeat protein